MNAEVAMSEVGAEAAKMEAATEVEAATEAEAVKTEVAGRISSVKRGHIVRAEGNK
jgi:glycine cleavage system H lipoate-binding protein